jgi:glycosyltransferase involved in cell wall biosynthesis
MNQDGDGVMQIETFHKRTVFYIGEFVFPHGNVQAELILSNARALRHLGFNVIIIGHSSKVSYDTQLSDTRKEYDGFIYYTVPFTKSSKDLLNLHRYYREILGLLEEHRGQLAATICYNSPTFAVVVGAVAWWCKRHRVAFIPNIADISALSHGSLVERFCKSVDRYMFRAICKYWADGIIAVSDYIRDCFSYRRRIAVVLPPLVDCGELPPPTISREGKVMIAYAGVPFPVDGRKVDVCAYKDRLDLTIDLLSEVHRSEHNFVLDIYGLTREQYLRVVQRHIGLLSELSDVIRFHGRTERDQIVQIVASADFTINFRDIKRMTTAGFSTKFVESISCGTPVITTNTSDLERYLVTGKNGYFVDISDREGAVRTLTCIMKQPKGQIATMKEYCYNSRLFDYRNYTDTLGSFVAAVMKSVGN